MELSIIHGIEQNSQYKWEHSAVSNRWKQYHTFSLSFVSCTWSSAWKNMFTFVLPSALRNAVHTVTELLLHVPSSDGLTKTTKWNVWLGGLVVSALGMRTRRPRFESRVAPLFHWVATLGKLFTHTASPVSQLQEAGVQKGSFRRLNGYGD